MHIRRVSINLDKVSIRSIINIRVPQCYIFMLHNIRFCKTISIINLIISWFSSCCISITEFPSYNISYLLKSPTIITFFIFFMLLNILIIFFNINMVSCSVLSSLFSFYKIYTDIISIFHSPIFTTTAIRSDDAINIYSTSKSFLIHIMLRIMYLESSSFVGITFHQLTWSKGTIMYFPSSI